MLSPGTRLGPYEILSPLGAGGMGAVYRAHDERIARDVAVKVLPGDLAGRPDRLRRLEKEARAAGALNHPNILAIHDFGTHEGCPYLVTELLEGQTLRDLLRREGPLSPRAAVDLALQTARGLGAAHDKGIVHRDLKPENLFITRDRRVKVLDFGLAKREEPPEPPDALATDSPTQSQKTEPGTRIGTVGYMSPEQVRGGLVDHRSDVFSLGVVLYEMLAGTRPFRGETSAETQVAILREDPRRLSEAGRPVPAAVEELVLRCLRKHPEERFQSSRDLAFALEAVSLSSDSPSPGDGQRGPSAWFTGRTRRWLARGLGAVAVLGAALLAWLALSARDEGLPQWTSRQLTSDPAWEAEPALSPDGAFVAFSSSRSGNADIWIVDARGGTPLQLTADPAADRSPAWFPDGSALAFASDRGGRSGIWKVPRLGGPALLLVPDAEDPSLSPDGRRIAFCRSEASGRTRIGVADLKDASKVTILGGDAQSLSSHRQPAWSPDGASLVYSDRSDLWRVPASGGAARRLTGEHAVDDRPVFSGDGRHVYFSSFREGTLALWRVPATGGQALRVTFGTGPETEPSLSRDGRRMAYSTHTTDLDVVILDRRSGTRSTVSSQRADCMPAVAPDGSRMIFSSNREGDYDLWVQPLAGGRPDGPARRLAEQAGRESQARFSSDGRFLAFTSVLEDRRDIWVVPATGGPATRLTDWPGMNMHAAWSPDGSRIAFSSSRGGQTHVWVLPTADGRSAGAPQELTMGQATDLFPSFSPDGSRVAFIRTSGNESDVWVGSVVPGEAPLPLTHGADARFLRWDPAGPGLLVSGTWGGDQVVLRRVSLGAGESVPFEPAVVFGDKAGAAGDFDLSADGALLAYTAKQPRGDIWLLEAQRRKF